MRIRPVAALLLAFAAPAQAKTPQELGLTYYTSWVRQPGPAAIRYELFYRNTDVGAMPVIRRLTYANGTPHADWAMPTCPSVWAALDRFLLVEKAMNDGTVQTQKGHPSTFQACTRDSDAPICSFGRKAQEDLAPCWSADEPVWRD